MTPPTQTTQQRPGMSDLKILAWDSESYYDKEISITTMGGYNYTRHPKTRPYMISAAASTGHTFVGSPDDFDFAAVSGPDWLWVCHNQSFDGLAYQRLHEENPEAFPLPANPPQCSADLCAFVGLPRALAGAVSAAYGVELSKSVRDKMKGKMPEDLTAEEQSDLKKYALDDAKWCLKLWMDFSPKWPQEEREVSLMTREMGWGGLPLNQEKVDEAKLNLQRRIWEARNKIPWAETAAALSPKQLAIACREAGIPCPTSLALDSEECAEWEDQYGDRFPWVDAMRTVRRCNALLKKLESMEARLMPNKRMNYDLKYVGAHTKRWSGGGGVNCQNLTSKELFGVDLRSMIEAPEGKTFIVADLAQIEPRCGALICKDWPFLDSLAAGVSPYIIHARQTMGLGADETWPKNDLRYKLAKARCLGLGYGCGHRKFLWMATNIYDAGEVFDQPVSTNEMQAYALYASEVDPDWHKEWSSLSEQDQKRFVVSKRIVDDYRTTSPRIISMWKTLGDALRQAVIDKEPLVLELPSGNVLRYVDIRYRGKETVGRIVKNGRITEVKLYGGLIFENCLAGETEVLTESGPKPLRNVSPTDRVWDGEDFVSHCGIVDKGTQPVVDLYGVWATPDHRFLMADGSWAPAATCINGFKGVSYTHAPYKAAPLVETCRPSGKAIWVSDSHETNRQQRNSPRLGGDLRLWGDGPKNLERHEESPKLREAMPRVSGAPSGPTRNTSQIPSPGIRRVGLNEGPLPAPLSPRMAQLRRAWNNCVSAMARLVRGVLGRYGANLEGGAFAGATGQQPRVLSRELPVGNHEGTSAEQARELGARVGFGVGPKSGSEANNTLLPPEQGGKPPFRCDKTAHVFDILNCGPRHRFAVRIPGTDNYLIAHNCIQSVARDAFRDCLLNVKAAGYRIILQVHDELVVEVDEDKAEATKADIERIMGISPTWAPRLPVAAEAQITKRYCK